MKKFKNFFKKNESGATLVIVVGVFSILLILVIASLSVASAARQQTYNLYCKNQAYFTANSAVNIFANKVSTDTNLNTLVKSLTAGSSYKTSKSNVPGLGEVEYLIKKGTNGKVTVTAKAYFQNMMSQSSVVLNGKEADPNMPLFDAAAVSLTTTEGSCNFFATGDVRNIYDEMELTNASTIYGSLYTKGNIKFTSTSSSVIQGKDSDEISIIATGDITVENDLIVEYSTTVKKAFISCRKFAIESQTSATGNPDRYLDIYCNSVDFDVTPTLYANLHIFKSESGVAPSISMDNGALVYGNVYFDGSLSLYKELHVKGDLVITGEADLKNVTVDGNIYCKTFSGTNVTCGGKIHAATGGQEWNEETDRPMLASKQKPEIPKPEDVFAPFQEKAENYIDYDAINNGAVFNKSQNNLVIDKSGRIINDGWGKEVTINVKDKDLWLKVECEQFGSNKIVIKRDPAYPETAVCFVVPSGKTLKVNNETTVLTDVTRNKIGNNEIFFVGNSNDESHQITKGQPVYWILEKDAFLNITKATIEGYIYGPEAKFEASERGKENTEVKFSIYGNTSGNGVFTKNVPLIGAVVVNDLKITNDCNVLYLIPLLEGLPGDKNTDPGEQNAVYEIDGYIRK